MFMLQFGDRGSGSLVTVSVGHVYDQSAGIRKDAAGNELQCCCLRLSVSWDDHRPMDPRTAWERAMFYAEVARVTRLVQQEVDGLGPTWQVITTAVKPSSDLG